MCKTKAILLQSDYIFQKHIASLTLNMYILKQIYKQITYSLKTPESRDMNDLDGLEL